MPLRAPPLIELLIRIPYHNKVVKLIFHKAVMRNFIIVLSILFFLLAGFVMYQEASLVEETFDKLAKEQEESRGQVKKLETMVAGLEKEKEMAEAETLTAHKNAVTIRLKKINGENLDG